MLLFQNSILIQHPVNKMRKFQISATSKVMTFKLDCGGHINKVTKYLDSLEYMKIYWKKIT